ncbi:MAG: DUF7133 domain-containing protein [Acidobacteriota bacterium]
MKQIVVLLGTLSLCLIALGLKLAEIVQAQNRFRGPQGFSVQEYYSPEKSGSVVAMTFDSRGRLAFSREKGPVVILTDENGAGVADREQVFTDRVTNCQGLQFDGNQLWAVGDGPEGTGLYRAVDQDGDGSADEVHTFTLFTRRMAEHGPHAVFFGPDGFLYLVLGNHTGLIATPDPFSPHAGYQEGNLLPIYTDPRGHARDIRAPGGTISRIDLSSPAGEWQMISGGFRNHYEAAFNLSGELFTFDSDMEWDIDLPWFREVRTVHVVPGGEYGWRTGSGKWPQYYLDSLPPMSNIDRGSPTGVTFYQSYAYPERYFDSFLYGDWSRGRILAGFLGRSGATYTEDFENLVLGEPLNVTDLEVGPDGCVYFSKGGRSTEGGIYRVVYSGEAMGRPKSDSLVDEALTQPQLRSAWSRARLSEIRERMKGGWGKALLKEARDARSSPARRVRALELLQVYGPRPDLKLLSSLGEDRQWEVRAAATYYLGLYRDPLARLELARRLRDEEAFVRRRACEALVRTEIHPGMPLFLSPVEDVLPLLGDSDRWVRYAARELLMRLNRNSWREAALKLSEYPAAAEALMALVATADDTQDIPYLLKRQLELLKASPRDEDLLALLRTIHWTLIEDDRIDYLDTYEPMGEILLERFPSRDQDLNRELAITLAYLETPGTVEKLINELKRPQNDRRQQIHYAYCLRTIGSGWEPEAKQAMIEWFKKTQREQWKGGASFLGFVENIWNDFLKVLPEEEKQVAMQEVPSLSPTTLEAGLAERPAFQRAAYNQIVSEKEMKEYLLWDPMAYTGDPVQGKLAYEKAFCASCHIHGDIGREAGPDLTDVEKRFQREDLIDAVLYPSRTVSDLWAAVEIVTKEDQSVMGVISREDADSLTLKTAAGYSISIPKTDIKSRAVSKTSLMPEGLLNNLDRKETIDLFTFLEQGARETAGGDGVSQE